MATPTPTSYTEIYDVFLSQITDPKLVSYDATDGMKMRLLLNAIPQFRRCKKDLSLRNDSSSVFTIDLSDEEKLILGLIMVREYMKPQIINYEKMQQKISNKDWTISSAANHLSQLIELRREVNKEISKLIVDYTYNNSDLSGLK